MTSVSKEAVMDIVIGVILLGISAAMLASNQKKARAKVPIKAKADK